MRGDELRAISLFGGLADDQLAELAAGGTEVRIEPGVELFHEGEQADFWWVLIDGAIDLLRRIGAEDTVVGRMDVPGRWAGGFRAWDEQGVYLATGRGAIGGRVLRVPADVLSEKVDAWFPFGRHLIQGLYRTARSIEATARQRESLVAMLGSKLGDGIAVVRDYSDGVPAIQAYPGELNQVWTSLIDNALDAMNGAGTLRLATRVEEDDVVVEVGDTGPGMPPQVASRAFDAFYTTKDTGQGPGLGLDIARRTVVERHGGLITIDSQPGNTVLRVRLPVRLAEGEQGLAQPPPAPLRAGSKHGRIRRRRSRLGGGLFGVPGAPGAILG